MTQHLDLGYSPTYRKQVDDEIEEIFVEERPSGEVVYGGGFVDDRQVWQQDYGTQPRRPVGLRTGGFIASTSLVDREQQRERERERARALFRSITSTATPTTTTWDPE